jgi:hypothetical protein
VVDSRLFKTLPKYVQVQVRGASTQQGLQRDTTYVESDRHSKEHDEVKRILKKAKRLAAMKREKKDIKANLHEMVQVGVCVC